MARMFPVEIFHDTAALLEIREDRRTNKDLLGCGAFGAVLAVSDHMVIKVASNDGTRDYLEKCLNQQAAGEHIKHTPKVYAVRDLDDYHYAVLMERCSMTMQEWESSASVVQGPDCGSYQLGERVAPSFRGIRFDDCHRGNVMWSPLQSEWVLTDPSSESYSRDIEATERRRKAYAADCREHLQARAEHIREKLWEDARAKRQQDVQRLGVFHDEVWGRFLAKPVLAPWPFGENAFVKHKPVVITKPSTRKVAAWKIPQLKQQQHMRGRP